MFLTEMESFVNDQGPEAVTAMTSRLPTNGLTCSVPQNCEGTRNELPNLRPANCSDKIFSQVLPPNRTVENGIYKGESEYKICDENVNDDVSKYVTDAAYVTNPETKTADVVHTKPAEVVMENALEQNNEKQGQGNNVKDTYDMSNLDTSDNEDMLVINTDFNEDNSKEDDRDDDCSRRSLRHKIRRRNVPEKNRKKRQTLQDMTRLLKQWLYKHKDNPYPTKSEKTKLALESDLTLTQVSNWFANARRRLKNTVKDPGIPWGTRIKVYNDHVTGNAELLSVSSEDIAWESDTDKDQNEKQCTDTKVEEITKSNIYTQTTPAVSSCPLPVVQQPPAQFMKTEFQPPVTQTPAPVSQSFGQIVQNHPVGIQNNLPAGIHDKIWMDMDNLYFSQDKLLMANMGHAESSQIKMEPKFVQHNSTSRSTVSSEVAEELDATREGAASPPKYKQTILQRYLHDSCAHSFQIPMSPPSVSGRHRHPSGSVGSHDYEDISISSRDSPVTLADRSEEEDLYWLEISAAMALTTLARSRVK